MNDNNHSSAFVPMPMFVGHHGQHWRTPYTAPVPENDQPARVKLAMQYVGLMVVKQMTRAAVNDISIEMIPGQTPTHQESVALINAAQCLAQYFAGTVDPDVWEEARIGAYEDKRRLEKQRRTRKKRGAGVTLHCPMCKMRNGQANPMCEFCGGSGGGIWYPNAKR